MPDKRMKVTVFRDADHKTAGFQVSGHSEYNPGHEDILCAAVSALATNCVNSIEAFTDDDLKLLFFSVNFNGFWRVHDT